MADYDIAEGIIEGLQEAVAWRKGELDLDVLNIEPMPAERIKDIRKRFAPSTKAFEKRFGIPAATMNNWEQGRRKPDPAARLLLRVIEQSPEAVEKAAHTV
jgi:putative transcriptional regulator